MPSIYWSVRLNRYMKKCGRCKTAFEGSKDYEETERIMDNHFCRSHQPGKQEDNFQAWCRTCNSSLHYFYKFGITKETAEAKLASQGGLCDICRSAIVIMIGTGQKIYENAALLDHEHNSNKVRGFLCAKCNALMGALDTEGWLQKAFAYRHKYR